MRRWYVRRSTLVSLVIILTLICVPFVADPRPAHASTVTVNSASDSGPGDCTSTCTLRDAIAAANPGDTITFDPTVFNVSRTILLTGGTLTIAKNLTISGLGASTLAIDGNAAVTVFTINGAVTVTISGLTVQHGNTGIINIVGTLTITNTTFSGNTAIDSGGGIYNDSGTLTVTNSTFSGNSAPNYGGGIFSGGTLTVSNSTFYGNTASIYGGGILNNVGTLTISNSTFSGNSTTNRGGAIYNPSGGTLRLGSTIVAGNTAPTGGADIFGTLTSLGNNIIGNTSFATGFIASDQQNVDPLLNSLASNGGPTQTMSLQAGSPAIGQGNCNLTSPAAPVAIDQRGVARKSPCDVGAFETGNSSVVRNTNDSGPDSLRSVMAYAASGDTITFDPTVFNVPQTITLTSGTLLIDRNLTINGPGTSLVAVDGNNASTVFTVNTGVTATLNGLTIQHGRGTQGWHYSSGGGVANSGTLTISNSTISNNSANSQGGSIYTDGTLTISNTTISNNSADFDGGGILATGVLTISNSTISGNISGSTGGGIVSTVRNGLTISNSTISNNSAFGGGGGIEAIGDLTLGSVVVAGNTSTSGPDINGIMTSLGNNLIGNTSGASGFVSSDQQNVDPLLNPLADNGGPTQTMSLQASSPAIGQGNCNLSPPAAPVATDQRGVARKSPCDVGAYEIAVDSMVRNTNDSGPGSLRNAISNAIPGDVILFDPTVFNVSRTITLTSGTLTIAKNLNIQGPGASLAAVDGNNAATVFTVSAGTVSISGLTIQHGNAGSGNGGGIYNHATLILNNTTFTGNSANGNFGGGAIYNLGNGIPNSVVGNLTVKNSTFSDNIALNNGGGIENDSGTLVVSNSTFLGNSATAFVSWSGAIDNAGWVTISNSTFSSNSASNGGGAITSYGPLTISNSTFVSNTISGADGGHRWGGGAILVYTGNTTITINSSTFSNNGANGFGAGGAIFNYSSGSYDTLVVNNSTFSGNSSSSGGGAISNSSGNLKIKNSTFSSNRAGEGGAITNGGTATINNSTVSGNSVLGTDFVAYGGGIYNAGRLNLGSTIVAGNTSSGIGPDIFQDFSSLGNNLIGDTNSITYGPISSDQVNVPALLNPLADNGGPTQTMSLQAGSPAIGKGNCNLGPPAAPVSTDQRGVARKNPCDVGAFESPFSRDTVGLYNTADGQFYLSKDNVNILSHFYWGPGGTWAAISGDWDGNGSDTIGLYNTANGEFYLSSNNVNILSHFVWGPGSPWAAIVGDWDGNGTETIGLYNTSDGEFYLTNNNSTVASHFVWGPGGSWAAIVGDWDGNGTDTIGLYNTANGEFYLTNNNSTIASHFVWGPGGSWAAIVGDWDGNGTETIGLYNTSSGEFYLSNDNLNVAQHFFWGPGGTWKALTGKWSGTTAPAQPSGSQSQPTVQPAPTFVPRK